MRDWFGWKLEDDIAALVLSWIKQATKRFKRDDDATQLFRIRGFLHKQDIPDTWRVPDIDHS